MDKFLQVINLIDYKSIISFVAGAIISALIAYLFSRRSEKLKIKTDLGIKSVDTLLCEIKHFKDSSWNWSKLNVLYFQWYDQFVSRINENTGIESTEYKQVQFQKEQIEKEVAVYNNAHNEYAASLSSVINILESRQVILNKFIGIREQLVTEGIKLNELNVEILHLYYDDIFNTISLLRSIDNKLIDQLSIVNAKFEEQKMVIYCNIDDLATGLQNEFMSRLFKYKVPYRTPKEPKYEVHRPGSTFKQNHGKEEN